MKRLSAALSFTLALAAWSGAQQTPQPLTVAIGERQVALAFPPPGQPPAATRILIAGEWSYPLDEAGNVLGRYRKDGRWQDVAAAYKPSAVQANYRIKVFVDARCDLIQRGPDGIYRMRRATFESSQINALYAALALFKAAVEVRTGGQIIPQIDVTTDTDPLRFILESAESPWSDRYIDSEIGPRVNSSFFEADDKQYRGPYNALFVLQPALTRGRPLFLLRGTPGTIICPYVDSPSMEAADIADQLLARWEGELQAAATQLGYRLPGAQGLSLLDAPNFWQALAGTKLVTTAQYIERALPPAAPAQTWQAAASDPLATLQDVEASSTAGPGATVVQSPAGPRLIVEVSLATTLLPLMSQAPKPLGRTAYNGGVGLVFEVPAGASVLALIDQQKARVETVTPPAAQIGLRAYSPMRAEKATDPQRGEVLRFAEQGQARGGYAVVDSLPAALAAPLGEALELYARVDADDPFELVFVTGDEQRWTFLLGPGRPAAIEEQFARERTTWLPLTTDNQWQRLVLDLKPLAGKTVKQLMVRAPESAKRFERSRVGALTLELAGFAATSDPPTAAVDAEQLTPVEQRSAAATGLSEQAPEAERAAFRELLKDPSEQVRLNAVARLTSLKMPEAVPALIDQSRSATPAIAMFAMRALAFQDSPDGWEAIRQSAGLGPFDYNRQYAAEQLGKQGKPESVAPISTLIVARSWRARAAAARSLGMIKTEQAAKICAAFLQETEPNVRYAVTEAADMSVDIVDRRILYGAVNDPSEAVRLLSYRRLLDAPNDEFRSEGRKGARDESPQVRLGMLALFESRADEKDRGAIRLAVVDSEPAVRAAALRALAAQPGTVEVPEFENVLADPDPRVQAALASLAIKKSLRLPADAIERLKSSRDPEVARLSRDLP